MNSSELRQNSFEALAVGSTWRSAGRTLTETDLIHSCMTSGDWHAIHADADHAAATALGGRVFHGTYGVHVAMGMATHFPPNGDDIIGALGISEWKYALPLFVGDTVHVEVEIADKRVISDGRRGIVQRRIRLVRRDGRVVQEGLTSVMLRVGPGQSVPEHATP